MTTRSDNPFALEAELRCRVPQLRFVSERFLTRVLAAMAKAGRRVPTSVRSPVWLSGADAEQFGLATDGESHILLLTPPDDRLLYDLSDAAVCAVYDRLLDRADLMKRLDDPAAWPDAELTRRWEMLPGPVRREARFVLAAEHALPPDPSEADVCRAFLPFYLELAKNRPTAVPDYFPLFSAGQIGEGLFAGLTLPSAEGTKSAAEVPLPPGADVQGILAHSRNVVRTAIQYYRRPEDRAIGVALLTDGLGGLLADTLGWDAGRTTEWQAVLAALLPHTVGGRWTPAAKSLYELQALALDLRDRLSAVAPFEWLRTFGKRPLRRPLDQARDVILLRHLAKARKQAERVDLPQLVRDKLHRLLEAERHAAEHRLRGNLGPVVRSALERAGLVPASRAEGVARDKLVGELLDGVCARGFFRLSDLRDALARNDLKLPDLAGPRELWYGDALLRADRLLGDELFGIYQRGEVYLRGIQRLSAVAFGTAVGRGISLFLIVPLLGAYLSLEFLQHILHAVIKVVHLVSPPAEPPPPHHGPHLVTWWSLLLVGGTILLLVNSLPARQAAWRTLRAVGTILGAIFVTLPQKVWALSPVQAVVHSRLFAFLWQTLAAPLLVAAAVFGVAVLYDLPPPQAVPLAVVAFAAVLAVLLTPAGQRFYERLAEGALDAGRYMWASVVPGVLSWIVWAFREVAAFVERLLYTVDEWFRFREGQSRESLVLKTALAVLWFPVAYVVRFVFYLLVEPQVNPVKHFPVVTVSHKVIWPMVPQLSGLFGISEWYVALIVNGVPGIFGFIAWELKENWRLYASNRPSDLQPVPIGHHGETVRRLFRPGFHSGTVPKLFRKLRSLHEAAVPSAAKVEKVRDELHHVAEAVGRLVEREYLPLAADATLRIAHVTLGCQRVEVAVACGSGRPLVLAWEFRGDEVVADEVATAGAPASRMALSGLNAKAAVPVSVRWDDWVKFWVGQPVHPAV